MSKPFLLLQIRPEDKAADGEYEAILKFGHLAVDDVVRIRLDRTDMPEFNLDDYAAVIVGGGPWNPGDPIEKQSEAQKRTEPRLFSFINRIIEQDKPCLGICYGLEAIAVATKTELTHEFSICSVTNCLGSRKFTGLFFTCAGCPTRCCWGRDGF